MGRMLGYAYMLISASSARGASLFCMGARHHELYGYGSGVQSHRQPRDDRAKALLALSLLSIGFTLLASQGSDFGVSEAV